MPGHFIAINLIKPHQVGIVISTSQKGKREQIKGLTQFTCLGIKMRLCVHLTYSMLTGSQALTGISRTPPPAVFVLSSVLDAA